LNNWNKPPRRSN